MSFLDAKHYSDMSFIHNAHAPEQSPLIYIVPIQCDIPKKPTEQCFLMINDFTGNAIPCWSTRNCPRGFRKELTHVD